MNMRDMLMLYESNSWANARILEAASSIGEEQYRSPGAFPHGGLRGTLMHTLFAEWVWRMRWQGAPPDVRWQLEAFPTFASLRGRWLDEEIRLMEFVDGLTDEELEVKFDYVSTEGDQHRRVMWEPMRHLINHVTQHRSEAAVMLSAMGHSPGDIDLIVFLNEGDQRCRSR